METEEERLDREFDALNEGLIAMQIIEWFEKENPEPDFGPHDDIGQADPPDEWWEWQKRLVDYAEGWKDALKALQERKILERCIEDEPRWFTFFEYIWARPEDYLVPVPWMEEGGERQFQYLIELMIPRDIEEELENGSSTR
jgi:hypothetical protein